MEQKQSVNLILHGANCASCAYTIEKLGRKITGIEKIQVNVAEGLIHVDYTGDKHVLTKITDIVHKIGYSAEIPE